MILFLDDEPFFVGAYVEALEEEGFSVTLYKRVDVAIQALEEFSQDIDLVITDVMMPPGSQLKRSDDPDSDMDTGFAFFDWIRSRWPDMPVIVLTNKATSDVDQKFGAQRKCFVCRKGPRCSPFRLVQHVRELLATSS